MNRSRLWLGLASLLVLGAPLVTTTACSDGAGDGDTGDGDGDAGDGDTGDGDTGDGDGDTGDGDGDTGDGDGDTGDGDGDTGDGDGDTGDGDGDTCDDPDGWRGDGYCDAMFNTVECGWDLGDCCASTCTDGPQYACGDGGFDCLDPSAPAGTPVGAPCTTQDCEGGSCFGYGGDGRCLKSCALVSDTCPSGTNCVFLGNDVLAPVEPLAYPPQGGAGHAVCAPAPPADSVWQVYGVSAVVDAVDADGASWDLFSGDPDPFICLDYGDDQTCFPPVDDTTTPNWDTGALGTYTWSQLGQATYILYDEDPLNPDDPMSGDEPFGFLSQPTFAEGVAFRVEDMPSAGADTVVFDFYPWRCDSDRYGDGVCDCGCGLYDPDCTGGGCASPGQCDSASCENCFDETGPIQCRDQCSCGSQDCGFDGCGSTCGSCSGYDVCLSSGTCYCSPVCGLKECGPNGCGGSCGSCPGGETCTGGVCSGGGGGTGGCRAVGATCSQGTDTCCSSPQGGSVFCTGGRCCVSQYQRCSPGSNECCGTMQCTFAGDSDNPDFYICG